MSDDFYENVDGSLPEVVPGDAWLHSNPRPISFCFSWTAIVAVAVVGATALVLDFVAFRASELENARQTAATKQRQGQARTPPNGGTSGHADADTVAAGSSTPLANGSGGGGKGGAVVAVRSGRWTASDADESRVHWKRACVLAGWTVGALVCHRMGLPILARVSATIGSFVACLPHLLRPSKYRRDGALGCVLEPSDKRRSITDMLVWTSLVYVVPSVYGLYAHQYGIATLQLLTTIGSTLFHLTRETKFFNLDNVFATSLLITTLWGFFLAVRHGIWWYVATVGLGGPFAVFCIVRCGMPGLVCRHPSGHGLCRRSNPEYDFFHVLWHLSSGLGSLMSIHYFEVNFPAEEAGGGWFYYFPDIPLVPTVSLAISALINFYGNRTGVMPLA